MSIKTETIKKTENVKQIFVYDENKPQDKRLTYRINKRAKKIQFYPQKFFLNVIQITGFSNLPDEFAIKGYIKAGVLYYLDKKLSDKKVSHLTISKKSPNSFTKSGKKNKVVINYESFKKLKERLGTINYEAKNEKSTLVDSYFYKLFPRRYEKKEVSLKQKANKIVKNLDEDVINELDAEGVEALMDFFEKLISTRYKSKIHKRKLFSNAKIKVDDIAISEIIKEFEDTLKKNPSESDWGKFLNKNLFLIDSKYIHAIPELNVMLAGCRKADFGLIDSQGYLDVFEIKKPTTSLLANSKDRGNHYWSSDATKAIVQAEKYLFNAERKAANLMEDIKKEKDLPVKVIKPRAMIIMGNSNQLDTDNKKEDFRILRMSLKHIEIVLYDELLDRIKAQKGKIFTD